MKLKEYLHTYGISVEEFAYKVGVSASAIWYYFSGGRKPTQKRAEKIETLTKGKVTVFELRGKDARKR